MGQRANKRGAKQRAQKIKRQGPRTGEGLEPGPEAFGIQMPAPAAPGAPRQRPDFSNVDWAALSSAHPHDAHRLRRAMYIAFVGERAKQAHAFMAWGLRPNLVHPQSRLARDNAAVSIEGEPSLISSTALYPTMNASEHLVAAAEVISLALTKGQTRTSAVAALCRVAIESSAKTIWLIRETETYERLRRCYGFIKSEQQWQEKFNKIEEDALDARTDALADDTRAQFEQRRARFAKRIAHIGALPPGDRTTPPGALDIVGEGERWIDEYLPRKPNPELDQVIHPRSAKSFYSLSSGFVHGFKWMSDYLFGLPDDPPDDSGLLEVTLDAFGIAIRMTECAVSLFEAQAIGPRPDPRRVRNYPEGLTAAVARLAPRYK